MSGFLGWLFGAKEQVAVAQAQAAPVVVNDEDDDEDDDWSSEGVEALARVQLLEREMKAMLVRLTTVERRLIEVGATVEEWRGE